MRYFQNKVAQSSLTLPLVGVFAALVYALTGLHTHFEWVCLPVIALCTYIMMEMNNRNVLMRVRSRMVSVTFLVLTMMLGTVNTDARIALVMLAMVFVIFLMSQICQDANSVGVIYYITLITCLASLVWQPALWLLPLFVGLLIRPLFAFSFRAVSAVTLGLLTPCWFYVIYLLYTRNLTDLTMLNAIVKPYLDTTAVLDYQGVTLGYITSFVILTSLSLFSFGHFVRYSYEDKIRVRVLMWFFSILSFLFVILMALVPTYANYILPMYCIPVSVQTAHFFVHTSSRFTNIMFIVFIVLILLNTVFNQCLTSLSSLALGA